MKEFKDSEGAPSSLKGLSITLAAQPARFVVLFAYQVLIARALSPVEFGVVALTAPFMAFAQLFADLGLSQSTIQAQSITDKQITFSFWFNVMAGIALSALSAVVAPLLGRFYDNSQVISVVAVSGLSFIISGAAVQHNALLNRELKFATIAAIDFSSIFLASLISLAAAWYGASYWAIVIYQIFQSFFTLVFNWYACKWRPSWPTLHEDYKAQTSFGLNLTGFNIVNFLSRNLDNILIGKFYGEVSLALYDRAYKLLILPLSQVSAPIGRVALPILSRAQLNKDQYLETFARFLHVSLFIMYPVICFGLMKGPQLIDFLLGEKWHEVSNLYTILALAGFFSPIATAMGWLFISQGRVRDLRLNGTINAICYVAAFAVGLRWGPQGVAWAFVLVNALRIVPTVLHGTRAGHVTAKDVGAICLPHFIAAFSSCISLWLLSYLSLSGINALCLGLALSYTAYIAALFSITETRQLLLAVFRRVVT